MSKALLTLIKLNKQELDSLRRSVAPLQEQKERFVQSIERLKEQLVREIELAAKQPDMAHFFGDFAKGIRMKEETARAEIAKLDKLIEELQERIRVKFGELKKFEIALENAKAREKEKQARRETEQLDEIAMQQFQRKED